MRTKISLVALVGIGLLTAAGQRASAVVVWNEGVNGDLSGDRLNPTAVSLGLGTNSIIATSVSGDLEYYRINIPAGRQLASIVLFSYSLPNTQSFTSIQAGTTFTEPPSGTNVANLLGWVHFGTLPGLVGTDILDNMGLGAGTIGFVPPLGPNNYTFWTQETGGNAVTYQFDLMVTPEPGSLGLLALASVGLLRRRR